MVKRKLKTTEAEPQGKTPKTSGEESIPHERRKEKLIPFDFEEDECDVIITTKDKEVHLPSSFLEMASKGETLPIVDGAISIDVYARNLVEALSFYCPKCDKDEAPFSKKTFISSSLYSNYGPLYTPFSLEIVLLLFVKSFLRFLLVV